MSTVLLLSGTTQGDALGSIARSFKSLFAAAGLSFTEVNFAAPKPMEVLNAAVQKGDIAFAFSFMALGAELSVQDGQGKAQNLWERLRIPFLSIYGDSPAYFFDRHVMRGANFGSLYGFPEHAVLRNRLPKVNGPVSAVAPILVDLVDRDVLSFLRKSKGKLIFLKNGNDPEALRRTWLEVVPPAPRTALLELASELAADLTDDALNQIDDLVLRYFNSRDIDIERLTKLRLFCIAQLDDYTRRLKSTLVARALLDFPVEIHGTGWEHLDFTGKRAVLVPDCDFVKSRKLIRESLGVIDMSPNTAGAPHDRPARAFGSYTLCLSNRQEGLIKAAPAQAEVSFEFTPDSVQSVVAAVLANPTRHVELGAEIAEKFRAKHPPAVGIAQMIQLAEMIRLDQWPGRLAELPPYFVWPPANL